jgi:hypothetical protein
LSICGYFLYAYFSFKKQIGDEYASATIPSATNRILITYKKNQYDSGDIKSPSDYIYSYFSVSKRKFYFGDIDKNKEKVNIRFSDNLNIDVYKYNDSQNLIVYNYKNHSTKYLLTNYGDFWEKIKKVKD